MKLFEISSTNESAVANICRKAVGKTVRSMTPGKNDSMVDIVTFVFEDDSVLVIESSEWIASYHIGNM